MHLANPSTAPQQPSRTSSRSRWLDTILNPPEPYVSAANHEQGTRDQGLDDTNDVNKDESEIRDELDDSSEDGSDAWSEDYQGWRVRRVGRIARRGRSMPAFSRARASD